ncbi:MAG: LCP family protein [Bowdeniella nasicola]|nr:LCP family protein [Bowdeniella nasicola]
MQPVNQRRGRHRNPARGPAHARTLRRPRWRATLAAALGVLLFLGTAFGLVYTRLQGNIERSNITMLLSNDRPEAQPPLDPNAGQPINLLVIGSDVRTGDFADPTIEGMRSDSTVLLHISSGRDRVEAISLPRDLLVKIPSCYRHDGSRTRELRSAKFNTAFALGGARGEVDEAAACTIRTVERMSGIYIDDYVVMDFQGFESMVNALQGVPLYIDEDINDRRADLKLDAGCRLLDGRQALGYARARYTLGDGSDVSRINRQHELLSSIAREVLRLNLLTDLSSLYSFLDAATSSMSTGEQIGSLSTMAGLAYSLRGIEPSEITFVTLPFVWSGQDIYPSEDAELVWHNLLLDQPVNTPPETEESPSSSSSSETGTEPSPTADPTTDSQNSLPSREPTPTQTPTFEHETTAETDALDPICTRERAS